MEDHSAQISKSCERPSAYLLYVRWNHQGVNVRDLFEQALDLFFAWKYPDILAVTPDPNVYPRRCDFRRESQLPQRSVGEAEPANVLEILVQFYVLQLSAAAEGNSPNFLERGRSHEAL